MLLRSFPLVPSQNSSVDPRLGLEAENPRQESNLRTRFRKSLSPERSPTVDVLVLSPDESVIASLQVKTRTYGRDKGWHMSKKHESIVQQRYFYAFVDLEPEQPITYIVPSSVVADVLQKSHQAWLAAPGARGQQRNDNPMRRIQPVYRTSSLATRRTGLTNGVNAGIYLPQLSASTEPATSSARGRTRTSDTRFRKPVLYPLSYAGGESRGNSIGSMGASKPSRDFGTRCSIH
jgi:hypothetical protein